MDEYEEKLFEGIKSITKGEREQVETTKPRKKIGALSAQEIIDEIL